MAERKLTYFTADVHLGLDYKDAAAREERFVGFLRSIPAEETDSLYLLGDIWDFWYEYRDVVPKGYVKVLSALTDLIDRGVKVWFFEGNHDIWTYRYFESLGMRKLEQPYVCEIGGKVFCLGHGDGLGKGMCGYKFMNKCFKCGFLQFLFSLLHPWIAFRLGNAWSKRRRSKPGRKYIFRGESEPLYQYALEMSEKRKIDCFIFGHYHSKTDMTLPDGAEFHILDSWFDGGDYLYWDGTAVFAGQTP